MPRRAHNATLAGQVYTFLAFLMWGLLPFYWKVLGEVPPIEILAHRIIWSALLMSVLVAFRHREELRWVFADRSRGLTAIGTVTLCALFLALNWYLYVWAVHSAHIVQASLGYYINPLVSILLGMLFLRERLRRLEVVALAFAAAGVLVLTFTFGRVPWVSLGLALSFGFYGILKKVGHLGAATSLALEMVILSPAALIYLGILSHGGTGHFPSVSPLVTIMLVGTGIITAAPLLLFGEGARRVPLSTVGFFQYVSPTLMLLIGTAGYHEHFGVTDVLSFSLIWTGLALYSASLIRAGRKRDEPAGEPVT